MYIPFNRKDIPVNIAAVYPIIDYTSKKIIPCTKCIVTVDQGPVRRNNWNIAVPISLTKLIRPPSGISFTKQDYTVSTNLKNIDYQAGRQ
jgi:hypothetical protein